MLIEIFLLSSRKGTKRQLLLASKNKVGVSLPIHGPLYSLESISAHVKITGSGEEQLQEECCNSDVPKFHHVNSQLQPSLSPYTAQCSASGSEEAQALITSAFPCILTRVPFIKKD